MFIKYQHVVILTERKDLYLIEIPACSRKGSLLLRMTKTDVT
jgi:hypothetical protein